MTTIIISTNASQATDFLIRDLGFLVPASGGSVTFTDLGNINDIKNSQDIRIYTNDDAFGPNSSTLIINDGTNDIAQDQVDTFLNGTFSIETLFLAIGGSIRSAGTLPVSGLGADIVMTNREFTQMRGRRGVAGTSGTTTVQLENNGTPVSGATLSWTSADAAFTLKTAVISTFTEPGTRLSLRLTATEDGNPQDIYIEVN